MTACMNVLKWFVSTHTDQGTQAIEAKSGRVRRTLIDFSIARWGKYTTDIFNQDKIIFQMRWVSPESRSRWPGHRPGPVVGAPVGAVPDRVLLHHPGRGQDSGVLRGKQEERGTPDTGRDHHCHTPAGHNMIITWRITFLTKVYLVVRQIVSWLFQSSVTTTIFAIALH